VAEGMTAGASARMGTSSWRRIAYDAAIRMMMEQPSSTELLTAPGRRRIRLEDILETVVGR
jgi:hypothetical protein